MSVEADVNDDGGEITDPSDILHFEIHSAHNIK